MLITFFERFTITNSFVAECEMGLNRIRYLTRCQDCPRIGRTVMPERDN